MRANSMPVRALLAVMTASGLLVVLYSVLHAHLLHPLQFGLLLLIAIVASRFKVKLPGLSGNMSVNLPFILIAMVELSAIEALIVALCSLSFHRLSVRVPRHRLNLFEIPTFAPDSARIGSKWKTIVTSSK